MTVNEKCFRHNIENLRQRNEKQYLKNKKYFVDLNIFSFFKKPRLMSKRSCFRTPFGSQGVNGWKALLKFPRQHFHPIASSFWDILIWKNSHLVGFKILGLFLNTLTVLDKFFRHNTIMSKAKVFLSNFVVFPKFA